MTDGTPDLWAAVVRLALADACSDTAPHGKQGRGEGSLERLRAWRFCTDPTGEWAQSRAAICWACGLDPDILRQEALRRGPCRALRAHFARMRARAQERQTPAYKPVSAERIARAQARIVALLESGYSTNAIGRALNVSGAAVRYWQKHGIPAHRVNEIEELLDRLEQSSTESAIADRLAHVTGTLPP